MRLSFLALTAAIVCFSASAFAAPAPGSTAIVSGRAHVEHQADGIHVLLGDHSSVAGFVPFDDKSTFPDIDQLNGHDVQITGVVDDKQQITLTNPGQIKVTN